MRNVMILAISTLFTAGVSKAADPTTVAMFEFPEGTTVAIPKNQVANVVAKIKFPGQSMVVTLTTADADVVFSLNKGKLILVNKGGEGVTLGFGSSVALNGTVNGVEKEDKTFRWDETGAVKVQLKP